MIHLVNEVSSKNVWTTQSIKEKEDKQKRRTQPVKQRDKITWFQVARFQKQASLNEVGPWIKCLRQHVRETKWTTQTREATCKTKGQIT
jgi:hypothetical protein